MKTVRSLTPLLLAALLALPLVTVPAGASA